MLHNASGVDQPVGVRSLPIPFLLAIGFKGIEVGAYVNGPASPFALSRMVQLREILKNNTSDHFVDAKELLEDLFEPKSRPTIRWLRDQQKTRRVPFVKIGRLIFFNPAKVREALNRQRSAQFGSVN